MKKGTGLRRGAVGEMKKLNVEHPIMPSLHSGG